MHRMNRDASYGPASHTMDRRIITWPLVAEPIAHHSPADGAYMQVSVDGDQFLMVRTTPSSDLSDP